MAGIVAANYVNSRPKGSSSGSLRVYIPSIMPAIPMGTPTQTPATINSACQVNASDCKQSIPNVVSTQNFITAQACGTFEHPAYQYGSSIYVRTLNDVNMECMLSPSSGDNSVEW